MSDRNAANHTGELLSIAVVGNYVPRQCGIATFTKDLCRAMALRLDPSGQVFAIAMDDVPEGYDYPKRVRLQIRAETLGDYRTAAEFVNAIAPDAVVVQHEFGIFGGPGGKYILNFMQQVRRPIVTTVHTVLDNPQGHYRSVMDKVIEYSHRLVIMSQRGLAMMKAQYPGAADKLVFVPHGIPDLIVADSDSCKDRFDIQGRRMILTFGLLSANKGIDVMLRALPEVVKHYPDVLYVVLGATHPNIKRCEGEKYRNQLEELVSQLNLSDNVMFVNKFVELDELCQWISAADLYVTPYLAKQQVTSGTLAYAVGAGKAVISTAYWHAEEILADGRGVLVPFGDSPALTDSIIELFGDQRKCSAMRKKAYEFGRQMTWKQVGAQYIELVGQAVKDHQEQPKALGTPRGQYVKALSKLPQIDLQHLRNMTDSTGMFQHAVGITPNRKFGYCTDDNARALIVSAMCWSLTAEDSILPLMHTYLSFLHNAYDQQSGRFRNFMDYNRQWSEQTGSADSHARAIWALGVLVFDSPNHAIRTLAAKLFNLGLPRLLDFEFPRSIAFGLVGIDAYLRRFAVDSDARRIRSKLANRLLNMFVENRQGDWPWCESLVTYCNARLPDALLISGHAMSDLRMVQVGTEALEWLIEVQTGQQGQLSVIGNQGWMDRNGHRARFDQQPVEAMTLVQACVDAYNIMGQERWLRQARKCLDWFLGRNDINLPMYDFSTGGCRDGLEPDGVNENQGAESTLAWLMSLCTLRMVDNAVESPAEGQVGLADSRLTRANNIRQVRSSDSL